MGSLLRSYLQKHWRRFSPNDQWSSTQKAKSKADSHDINWPQFNGRKNGHKSHGRKATPEDGSDVSAVGFWEVELTFDGKGCDVEAIAHLHADVQEEEEAHDGDQQVRQDFLSIN